MEKEVLKKAIYKQQPKANLVYIRKGTAFYMSSVNVVAEGGAGVHPLMFEVPVNDMGDAKFLPEMEARLLIRWLM